MRLLKQLLVLLSLALLTAQGAFAHEQVARVSGTGMAMPMHSAIDADLTALDVSPHCPGLAAAGLHCGHQHSLCCCAAACGFHCGALFVSFQFESSTPDSTLPQPLPELRRDGLTHAPPVRPPIG